MLLVLVVLELLVLISLAARWVEVTSEAHPCSSCLFDVGAAATLADCCGRELISAKISLSENQKDQKASQRGVCVVNGQTSSRELMSTPSSASHCLIFFTRCLVSRVRGTGKEVQEVGKQVLSVPDLGCG